MAAAKRQEARVRKRTSKENPKQTAQEVRKQAKPGGPGDRKNSFSLERMKKKKKKTTIPPRMKFSFSHEIFILGLKISFSIENFNPRPCFSAAREGPRMKISFSIENFIPYWKLEFFNIASRDWIFSILGPSGKSETGRIWFRRARSLRGPVFQDAPWAHSNPQTPTLGPHMTDILNFHVLFAPPEKGERGRKRPTSADFLGRAARHPLDPHLLHHHLRHS